MENFYMRRMLLGNLIGRYQSRLAGCAAVKRNNYTFKGHLSSPLIGANAFARILSNKFLKNYLLRYLRQRQLHRTRTPPPALEPPLYGRHRMRAAEADMAR
jgi:hypothetical protein